MTTSQVTMGRLRCSRWWPGSPRRAGHSRRVTAEWAFKQNPKQQGVNVSTPTPRPGAAMQGVADPKPKGPEDADGLPRQRP